MAGTGSLNKALLDTDIFSEITKGLDPTVVARASAYRAVFARHTISLITFMEVVAGDQKKGTAANESLPRGYRVGRGPVVRQDHRRTSRPNRGRTRTSWTTDRPGRSDDCGHRVDARPGTRTGNTSHFERVQQLCTSAVLVNWRIDRQGFTSRRNGGTGSGRLTAAAPAFRVRANHDPAAERSELLRRSLLESTARRVLHDGRVPVTPHALHAFGSGHGTAGLLTKKYAMRADPSRWW